MTITRRTFLGAAAGTAAMAGLTACAADKPASTATDPATAATAPVSSASQTSAAAVATATSKGTSMNPTVILVHGAFADSSRWNEVATILTRQGQQLPGSRSHPAGCTRAWAGAPGYVQVLCSSLCLRI